MKLTPEQLNTIKDFIHSKGYSEPDLLMEMLDHVACSVEEKIASHPEMPFEQASS